MPRVIRKMRSGGRAARSPSYSELYVKEKERQLDLLARAQAGQEGRPGFSVKPSDSLERNAWLGTDPQVTPEHLAQIAQQTVQTLSREKDELGQPKWTPEEIESEVRLQQSLALHPWRSKTFTSGVQSDDVETMVKEAERIARKVGQQPLVPPTYETQGGGWEQVDESDVLGPSSAQAALPEPTMAAGASAEAVPQPTAQTGSY